MIWIGLTGRSNKPIVWFVLILFFVFNLMLAAILTTEKKADLDDEAHFTTVVSCAFFFGFAILTLI